MPDQNGASLVCTNFEWSVYLFISEAKAQVGPSGPELTLAIDDFEQLIPCLSLLNAKISGMSHHTQFGLCILCDRPKASGM